MPTVRSTEEVLQLLRDALPDLRQRYPIARIGIFGSYARGEQTPDSDVDVLVEFDGPVGLNFVDFCEELETLFGKEVDVITERSLRRPWWREEVFATARYA